MNVVPTDAPIQEQRQGPVDRGGSRRCKSPVSRGRTDGINGHYGFESGPDPIVNDLDVATLIVRVGIRRGVLDLCAELFHATRDGR
jgi:hypothetical protein